MVALKLFDSRATEARYQYQIIVHHARLTQPSKRAIATNRQPPRAILQRGNTAIKLPMAATEPNQYRNAAGRPGQSIRSAPPPGSPRVPEGDIDSICKTIHIANRYMSQ